MEQDSNQQIIYASIFNPNAASLFKSYGNDKGFCKTIRCNNSHNCPLFASGQCVMVTFFSDINCPYGERTMEYGPAKRNKKKLYD